MGILDALSGGPQVSKATHRCLRPIRSFWQKEVKEATKGSRRHLCQDEVIFISVAALAVVVLALVGHSMHMAKWSNMVLDDFTRYHPVVPWLTIISQSLYILAIKMKGVDYWLVYFPAVLSIVMSFVLLGLIHGTLDPSALEFFDFGWDFWNGKRA
jgi:hypothetical protein